MNLIKHLRLFWKKFTSNIEAQPITDYQVDKLVNTFPSLNYYEILDSGYKTTDLESIKKVIDLIPIYKQKWKKNIFDCDDFAWEMRYWIKRLFPKFPIGYVHVIKSNGELHAMNCVIYINNIGKPTISLLEPQIGKVSRFDYKPYLVLI